MRQVMLHPYPHAEDAYKGGQYEDGDMHQNSDLLHRWQTLRWAQTLSQRQRESKGADITPSILTYLLNGEEMGYG